MPTSMDCLISSRQAFNIQGGSLEPKKATLVQLVHLGWLLGHECPSGETRHRERRESLGKSVYPIARGQVLRMEFHQASLSGQPAAFPWGSVVLPILAPMQ